MKFDQCRALNADTGPAPHGAGGLKFSLTMNRPGGLLSRPARGGWIEILQMVNISAFAVVPPRTGRVD